MIRLKQAVFPGLALIAGVLVGYPLGRRSHESVMVEGSSPQLEGSASASTVPAAGSPERGGGHTLWRDAAEIERMAMDPAVDHDSVIRSRLLLSYAELCASDPGSAMELLRRIRNGTMVPAFSEVLVRSAPVVSLPACAGLLRRLGNMAVPFEHYGVIAARLWKDSGREEALRIVASEGAVNPAVLLQAAAGALARLDPGFSAQQVSTEPDAQARKVLIEMTGGEYARIDPDKALVWVASLPPSERDAALKGFLASASYTAPRLALLASDKHGLPLRKDDAIRIAGRLTDAPLEELHQLMKEFAGRPSVQQVLPVLVTARAREGNFDTTLLDLIEDASGKQTCGSLLVSGWLAKDPASAVAWLKSREPDFISFAMGTPSTAAAVAGVDAQTAMQMAAQMPLTDAALPAFCAIAEGIARSDPKRAGEWCSGLGTESAASAAAAVAARGIAARKGLPDALAFAAGLPEDSKVRAGAVREIGIAAAADSGAAPPDPSALGERDAAVFHEALSEASAWRTLPEPLKSRVLRRAELPGNPQLPEVSQLVRLWAGENPGAATAWLAAQESGNWRADSAEIIAGAWFGKEPERAAEWINTLPEGPVRAGASLAAARALIQSNPDAAMQWLERARSLPDFDAKAAAIREAVSKPAR